MTPTMRNVIHLHLTTTVAPEGTQGSGHRIGNSRLNLLAMAESAGQIKNFMQLAEM